MVIHDTKGATIAAFRKPEDVEEDEEDEDVERVAFNMRQQVDEYPRPFDVELANDRYFTIPVDPARQLNVCFGVAATIG
jgi:hypothetical protein